MKHNDNITKNNLPTETAFSKISSTTKTALISSASFLFLNVAGAQAAEPIKLSIGGFMQQKLVFIDQDAPGRVNVDQQGFGQIDFRGMTKLDNGLGVGVSVEALATQWNDSRNAAGAINNFGNGNTFVRRAYLTLTSAYGQAIMGQREDYGFIVSNRAPDVGWSTNWSDVFVSPTNHAGYFETENSRYNARSDKITLITPTLAGLSAGFTYAPDISQRNTGSLAIAGDSDAVPVNSVSQSGAVNRSSFAGDMYMGGVAYTAALGEVSVRANATISQFNIANLTTYQGGLQASYAGFTLGGSIFSRSTDGDVWDAGGTRRDGKAQMRAGTNWDVGLSYAFGPYAISASYFYDRSKRDASDGFGGRADSTDIYTVSGRYTLGPGVDFRTSLYAVDFKNNSGVSNDSTENSGVALLTGLQVVF